MILFSSRPGYMFVLITTRRPRPFSPTSRARARARHLRDGISPVVVVAAAAAAVGFVIFRVAHHRHRRRRGFVFARAENDENREMEKRKCIRTEHGLGCVSTVQVERSRFLFSSHHTPHASHKLAV